VEVRISHVGLVASMTFFCVGRPVRKRERERGAFVRERECVCRSERERVCEGECV